MIQVCAIIEGRIEREDSFSQSDFSRPTSQKSESRRLEFDFPKRLLVGPMFARINNKSLHAEPGYCEHKKAYITQKGKMIVRVNVDSGKCAGNS